MAKFKNEKGLTLIELLITISVLAVVSAIALPVINNVVASSNSNATVQTQNDVTDFITKYNAAGETLFSSSVTTGAVLSGYVDADGDNVIDSNELVDTLTIDPKFSASVAGTSDNVGGSYTNDGVTGATVTLAAGGAGAPAASGFTSAVFTTAYSSSWFGTGTEQDLSLSSYNASTRTLVMTEPLNGMCMWDLYIYDSAGNFKGAGSSGYGGTTLTTVNDGTNCTYTADFNVIEASASIPFTIDPATDVFVLTAGSYNPNRPFTLN